MEVYCHKCQQSFCSNHNPTPKQTQTEKKYSTAVLSYEDVDYIWSKSFKSQS